jgi:SAM-dependent methyltransferase
MTDDKSVDAGIYGSEYFLERCGGVEFFQKYGFKVLKPSMQFAIQQAGLAAGDRVLDIGCGRGELVAHLHDKGFDATGIDYSEAAVACAKELYPKGDFRLVRSDQPLFEAASFDKIFMLGTIEHLYEPEIAKTLAEIKRLLRPGGVCVITTCTNALYYKTRSYKLRGALAGLLRMTPPRPSHSDEDLAMHVNEKQFFSLRASLTPLGLPFLLIACPNPKLASIELYGKDLPADFPLRPKSAWAQAFYRTFVFHFPLNLLLARSYAAVIRAPA